MHYAPFMANEPLITLSDVIAMAPGIAPNKTWINNPFHAIPRNSKQIKPTFFGCDLCDPQNQQIMIQASGPIDFSSMEGQIIEIGGQGNVRGVFESRGGPIAKVNLGGKSTVKVVGQGQPAATPSPAAHGGSQGYSDAQAANLVSPAQTTAQQGPQPAQNVPTGQQAGAIGQRPLGHYGPAVGGSIEIAAHCLMAQPNPPMLGTSDFAKRLYELASDILRVNEFMEGVNGKLAPTATDRENPNDVIPAPVSQPVTTSAAELPHPGQVQHTDPLNDPNDLNDSDDPF